MSKAPRLYGSRWRVVDTLGEGGQGIVYRVEDATGQHAGQFALKRILNSRRPDRFENEVNAGASLAHEHVLPLVDHNLATFRTAGEPPYLVTPIAAGKDLSKRKGLYRDALDTTIAVARQVCAALSHAHAKRVIHRDIKPENILFKKPDEHDIWLADFGICLLSDAERHTEVDERVGPQYFMAPELEKGGQLDATPAADVYSLGKLIFYLISGGGVVPRESIDDADASLWVDKGPRYGLLKALLMRTICLNNIRIQSVADVDKELGRIEDWERKVAGPAMSAATLEAVANLKQDTLRKRSVTESNRAARKLETHHIDLVVSGLLALVRDSLARVRDAVYDPGIIEFDVTDLSEYKDEWLDGSDNISYRVLDGLEFRVKRPAVRLLSVHVVRFVVAHNRAYSGHVDDNLQSPPTDVPLALFSFSSSYIPGTKQPYQGVGSQHVQRGTTPRVAFIGEGSGKVTLRLSEWPAMADQVAAHVGTVVEHVFNTLMRQ